MRGTKAANKTESYKKSLPRKFSNFQNLKVALNSMYRLFWNFADQKLIT